ncbi:MAG: alkaline phosphatase family protein, partial [Gemmatimonadaceae bacterium]|nr:alkaline phosphatase family protein [Gemmatimonadaceae bacterium]
LDGRFTTSRYYADTLPTWAQQFNATDFTAKYLGTDWTLLLDASQYPEKDTVPYEHSGKDFVFPHRLDSARRAGTYNFTDYPWMDDATVNMALAGVNAMELGKGPTLDVLAVSLSTTDAIGHAYGPNSLELHDQVLRADRALGRLIDSLFVLRDSTRIVFALSADHGVTPLPEETMPGTDPDRGRVNTKPVIDAARSALASQGVEGDALLLQAGILSLDRRRLAARGVNSDSVITALRKSLLALPGMLRVDRVSSLAAAAKRGDKIARRWLNAVPNDMDAELTVTFKPGYYWFETRYATHGSPHDLDARIPIIFMGPMFSPGKYGKPVRSVDIAPTLGAATDIPPIEPVDGRVLTEALQTTRRGRAASRP